MYPIVILRETERAIRGETEKIRNRRSLPGENGEITTVTTSPVASPTSGGAAVQLLG
jgi:hypothetical protein